MLRLAVYMKEGLPFARDLSLENFAVFDWLYFTQCLTLDFFFSSDASVSFTMAFPPLGNSGHGVV